MKFNFTVSETSLIVTHYPANKFAIAEFPLKEGLDQADLIISCILRLRLTEQSSLNILREILDYDPYIDDDHQLQQLFCLNSELHLITKMSILDFVGYDLTGVSDALQEYILMQEKPTNFKQWVLAG